MSALVLDQLRHAHAGPISLRADIGTCVAITGPSGAGKSLLLRMIADLDPHEGDAALGELRRGQIPAPDWRRAVCYVPADAGWWMESVVEHLPPARRAAATALAAELLIEPASLSRPVRTLSTGERQRCALIRALAAAPRALLLDEPTGALDPVASERVEALLRREKARGTILILVTHDEGQAARLGDARYRMAAGRLSPV